jgi:hypothetical protein
MSNAYHIYMKREGTDNEYIDIEADSRFTGMKYSKCTGLNDKGKRKNVYIESYPEENTARTYMGQTVTREPTDINLTMIFSGNSRQASYEAFCAFIENSRVRFYDSVRMREVLLILNEPVKPSEEVFKGSEPYMEVPFKFKNIWGESRTPISI